jgi:hypothetical protein
MAKLTRKSNTVFGLLGITNDFGVFGSKKAEDPVKSMDIELIQSLDAWDKGWNEAIVDANKAPYLEDMNGAMLVMSYQLGYILQEGIPEWDDGTTYYQKSIVKKTGTYELYGSKTDTNMNNALPSKADNTNWKYLADLADIIPDASIVEAKIGTGAVTEGKIGTGAVTEGKIGTGAVTADKIGTGAVTADKIGTGTVTEGKIGTGAVTEGKIGSLAVTSGKLAADSVINTKIPSGIDLRGNVLKSTSAYCRVYLASDQQILYTTYNKLLMNSVAFDIGSNWNSSSKRYYFPVSGRYYIYAQWATHDSTGYSMGISFYINGYQGSQFETMPRSTDAAMKNSVSLTDVYQATAGEYLEVYFRAIPPGGIFYVYGSILHTYLNVYLIG